MNIEVVNSSFDFIFKFLNEIIGLIIMFKVAMILMMDPSLVY